MTPRVIGVYNGDFDELMLDYIKHEKIIESWKKRHKGYYLGLKVEIDGNEFYTLTLECKKQ
tara:strand:+ start:1253 stop:1435 length:183 start_codon:yes stop_codon:yes gene_type:complete